MHVNWVLTALAAAQLAAPSAQVAQTPASHFAPKPWAPSEVVRLDDSDCWVAQCYLDGYTLHWEVTYSTYQEAEAARAEHARNNDNGRHQTITDTCK